MAPAGGPLIPEAGRRRISMVGVAPGVRAAGIVRSRRSECGHGGGGGEEQRRSSDWKFHESHPSYLQARADVTPLAVEGTALPRLPDASPMIDT